jgi:Ca2+-binding RTX toxin-like protein
MANIGSGVSIVGVLDTNADTDQFDLVLNAGEVYDFWLAPETPALDPISDAFLLLADGGGAVASDDESAEGENATFIFQPSTTGLFTLTAREFTGIGDGGVYALTIVNKSREADISDHVVGTTFTSTGGPDVASIQGIGTNAVLAQEDILNSSIANRPGFGSTDIDTVAVFLTATHIYNFFLQGADSGVTNGVTDSQLRFLDNEGAPSVTVNTPGSSDVAFGTSAPTGWYFLEVSAGADLDGGNYRLFFTDTSTIPPSFAFDVPGGIGGAVFNTDPDASLDNPFNLPLGDTIQGDIEIANDQDWYAINLVAGFTYRFTGEGGTLGNMTVQVHDSGGAAVGGASASGAEPQSVQFTATVSGLYYIDIHGQTAGDTGSFALSSTLVSTVGVTAHNITGLLGTEYDGSDLFDVITGGTEGDDIDGRDGNDTLAGGLGNDTIGGGETGGSDVISGDAGNDQLSGDDGNDTIDGGADNDSINGNAASDSLLGGLGADSINAGSGLSSDTVDGGDGNDTITGSDGNDGSTADFLMGGLGDDSITSAGTSDTLLGGDGNDILLPAAGPASMDGGIGNDTILAHAGDTVTAGAGVDQINSLIGWTLDTDEENLTLIGASFVNGNGNGGSNVIFGNDGNNTLQGLGGNDTVNGGAGNDTLVGGGGKDLNTGSGGLDHIKFNALSESGITFATRDAINTFAHGDKIDLSAIDASTNVAGNQAFTFSTSQTLTGLSGLLIAQQVATNSFLVLADVNGDHNADFSLNVYTSPGFGTFHNWDFIL